MQQRITEYGRSQSAKVQVDCSVFIERIFRDTLVWHSRHKRGNKIINEISGMTCEAEISPPRNIYGITPHSRRECIISVLTSLSCKCETLRKIVHKITRGSVAEYIVSRPHLR